MQTLTSLERLFLRVEKPQYPMDACGVFVLEPTEEGGPLTFDRVRDELSLRVGRLPVFTRRVVEASFGLASERWAADPDFAIDHHLYRVALPAPGTLVELRDLVLALGQTPLDRSRPLWQAWYVEGVDGPESGRAAVLLRMHHALIDGMGGMQMLGELFDFSPVAASAAEPSMASPVRSERVPSGPELLLRSVPDLVLAPFKGLRSGVDVVRGSLASRAAAKDGGPARSAPPRSVFNRPVTSGDKSLAFFSLPLEEVKEVRKAFGATVNDVVLAVVTGALRSYLRDRDEAVDAPLTAMCPMNVRAKDDTSGIGNQFAMLFNALPVDDDDPVAQLREISAQMTQGKGAAEARRGIVNSTAAMADIPHPLVWNLVGDLVSSPYSTMLPPVMNLVASNILGPPFPMYFAGARITHFYGRTMVISGVGLFIHCISYDGSLEFGITALRQLVPDPDALAAAARAHLDVLLECARTRD
ncbi:MAG: Diacylglycerol O-acyltransferase [Frankiales bacterium]|nr:Diacylglycerol O-acyltransferase [Frankiales bacterium]